MSDPTVIFLNHDADVYTLQVVQATILKVVPQHWCGVVSKHGKILFTTEVCTTREHAHNRALETIRLYDKGMR